jgi:hypothetical protein
MALSEPPTLSAEYMMSKPLVEGHGNNTRSPRKVAFKPEVSLEKENKARAGRSDNDGSGAGMSSMSSKASMPTKKKINFSSTSAETRLPQKVRPHDRQLIARRQTEPS